MSTRGRPRPPPAASSIVSTYAQTSGSTILSGGTLSGSLIDIQGGSLSGSGSINAPVRNAGEINPGGAGTGPLAITGNYTQLASGVLNIDLGGLTAGSQFDQLAVTGTATLDGTLNVDLIGGFTPSPGDTFQIMTYASSTGTFATINGHGATYNPTYGSTGLTLTVVSPLVVSGGAQPSGSPRGSAYARVASAPRWRGNLPMEHGVRWDIESGPAEDPQHPDRRSTRALFGWATPNSVWIDQNAAGYGWFVDATPGRENEEFGTIVGGTTELASAGSPATGKVDLLSVLMHEMGHVLGLEHGDELGVMGESLGLGVRRVPEGAARMVLGALRGRGIPMGGAAGGCGNDRSGHPRAGNGSWERGGALRMTGQLQGRPRPWGPGQEPRPRSSSIGCSPRRPRRQPLPDGVSGRNGWVRARSGGIAGSTTG